MSPTIAVLGGINGAGKTTASKRILQDALAIPVFVNADAIARGLNAFDPESESVKAGRIMLDHMHDLVARGRSFAFETTLSARTYAPWLGRLREKGYIIHLFYYWLNSPDLAINRVAERVRAGGHHVPDETIRRRYSRSVHNFFNLYRPVVTTWQVRDNTHGRTQLIACSNGYFDTIVDPSFYMARGRKECKRCRNKRHPRRLICSITTRSNGRTSSPHGKLSSNTLEWVGPCAKSEMARSSGFRPRRSSPATGSTRTANRSPRDRGTPKTARMDEINLPV